METSIDFNQPERAYASKTNKELKLAAFLYSSLNNKILGPIGKAFLKLAIKLGLPVKGIIRATLYKHFVGGETLEECLPIMKKMGENGVYSILDYSEEGKDLEQDHKHAYEELLKNIRFSASTTLAPICVFKVTAICSAQLLEKISAKQDLTEKDQKSWLLANSRFDHLCLEASKGKLRIMIDAEESWIQPAIDRLAIRAMMEHNHGKVVVLNTYQMYLSESLHNMNHHWDECRAKGVWFGAKVVRGAYMEKESARAAEKGYPNPIQKSKEATDEDYNMAIHQLMTHLDEAMVIVATHNENSTSLAAEFLMRTYRNPQHEHVWFSQLQGMCDHISYTLSGMGFNVAKYIPYGPVKSVTPYLIRRAEENSSVQGQAIKELAMIRAELKRRGA